MEKHKPAPGRIGVLDGFRGISALCVVYYHYTSRFRSSYGHSFSEILDFHYGFCGVWLFFMISGFVIFLTVEKCKSTAEFIYRRLTRLYPTYWIAIFYTVLMSLLLIKGYKVDLKLILINMTMLENYVHADLIDGAYWSLFPELVFYAIIILTMILKITKRVYIWGLIWLIITLSGELIGHHLSTLFFGYTGFFFSGVLFYLIFKGEGKWHHHFFILVCLLTELLINRKEPDFIVLICIIVFIFGLFYLFVYNKINFLDFKILRFLGFISYPLYLIHQNVGYAILLYLRSIGFGGYWVIFVPILVSLCAAYLIAKYIEVPVLNYCRANMSRMLNKLKYSKPVL